MNLKYIALVAVAAAAFFMAAGPKGDPASKEKLLMQLILDGLGQLHFAPGQVDDNFSTRVYDLYVDRMDYNKRIYTNEDIKKLQAFKTKIDDQVLEGDYKFFNLSLELFDKRMVEIETYFEDILAKPFDFNTKEQFESDPEKMNFAADSKELRERWRLFLKYSVLDRLMTLKERQKESAEKGEKTELKTDAQLEVEARTKVLEIQRDWYKRMTKFDREDRLEVYLNCITSSYDPHTNYFAPEDKENFDIGMSGKLEGIGASLREENGYTKVISIVPGSPSAKQGELKENDLILAVAQGDAEPVDVVDMKLDDVVKKIRGAKGTTVRLTVKKPDGTEKIISIVRDVVVMEESFAKSAVLTDKNTKRKIGFIHLPKFYADFDDRNGRRCSVDMKKEIEKLNAENVDGIIIDLRFNGGGSLTDVVDMSGYFFDEGPVVQVKSRETRPYVMSDKDPKVLYDGPLVILINGYSASASEIMAAALQDYGRAVIVGSTSFGKGTVQRFFDLDQAVTGYNDIKPLGAVKMTIQKFYRINGGSTQLEGVRPDIELPDPYRYIEVGEREEDYPMEWTEISPASYKKINNIGNLDAIKLKSQTRVKADPVFQRIEAQALWMKSKRDETQYPLSITAYEAWEKDLETQSKQFEDIKVKTPNVDIDYTKADAALEVDESIKKRTKEWFESLGEDPYVNEAVNIIGDMVRKK